MSAYRGGCPLCSGVCRLIGTTDHGKVVEIACANCTVYRISISAVKLFTKNMKSSRNLYALLAARRAEDQMILIGTILNDLTYEYVSIELLKQTKVHHW